MKVLRTYYLHLSSKNRDGGMPYAYEIVIPDLILESERTTEIFKISLLNFSCYFDWFVISEGFNSIMFHNNITHTDTIIDIPEGNYTYQELAQTITKLYNPCVCSWDKKANKMVFTFTQSHTLYFDGIYEKLGFDYGATPTGTTISSHFSMKPLDTTHLLINLNNLPPYHDGLSLDNITGSVKPSNILGSVVVNAPPFQLITYENQTDTGIFTTDTKLNRLSVSITNQDGVLLPFMPEHYITLKLDVCEVVDTQYNELMEKMEQISTTLRSIWLSKAIKNYYPSNYR